MTKIKRVVLDVLKPHTPSIIELAQMIGDLSGVSGVNVSLQEVDKDTDSVKITVEGEDIDYEKLKSTISENGAAVHSIDGVSAGMEIVEEVNTPQDR